MTGTIKTRKRIGVDLDDVLLDLNPALCEYHNSRFGTAFTPEDVTDYDLWNLWNCTKKEAFRRVDDFFESPEHLGAVAVSGAREAVPILADRYDLFLITAKPERLRDMTGKWISENFPGMFQEMRFTGGYGREPGNSVKKSEVCLELGIRTFIDDAIGNARDLAPHVDRIFLLDAPWNRESCEHPAVTRVFSWDDIIRHLA